MFRLRGLHLSTIGRLLRLAPAEPASGPLHVLLCVADHYEPKWAAAPPHVQQERVERWVRDYPRLAAGIEDSRGRPPQHTFFYPAEEYEPEYLDQLAGLCRRGLGDVEIHLHHDHDTSAAFARRSKPSSSDCSSRTACCRRTPRAALATASSTATGPWTIRGPTAAGAA